MAYQHKSGGVCFFDTGLDKPGSSPFHIIEGPFELIETPRGLVYTAKNGDTVQELKPEQSLWRDWQKWIEFLESPDGAKATQDIAIEGCK
ncbi:MAG: hypothetical protein WCK54_03380 [Desulfuromonadales bacterium]